jgi:hypothetical protein
MTTAIAFCRSLAGIAGPARVSPVALSWRWVAGCRSLAGGAVRAGAVAA